MTVRFSRRLVDHLARPQTPLSPRPADAAAALPPFARDFEAALVEATGSRGLPVVQGWELGAAAAAASGAPMTRAGRSGIEALIGRHPSAGAVYLRGDSHVERAGGGTIARDVHAWVERLVLLEQFALPIRARCGRMPRSVERAAEASDGWVDCWLDDGLLFLIHEHDVELRCASAEALGRFLAWASREREEVHLDTSGDYEIRVEPNGDALNAAVYSVTRRCTYECAVDVSRATAVETKSRHGRRLTSVHFGHGGAIARIHDARSHALEGHVSTRVLRYADACGIVRVPEDQLGFDALARELDARGLPFVDAWFEFEERFGGLAWEGCEPYWEVQPPQLGVAPFLRATEMEVEDLREGSRWLRDATFPAARIGDELVLRIAHSAPDAERWLMDERGRVYSLRVQHAPEEERIDRLRLEADSATLALEKLALRWEMRTELPTVAPVLLDVCLGERLASKLGAAVVAEASDAVSQVHRLDDVWIWCRPGESPDGPRTSILARQPARVAEIVGMARSLAPVANVRVRDDLPGAGSTRAALQAAGIPLADVAPA